MATIHCPTCQRVLGDTSRSIDATINCKRCGAQRVRITIADHSDYLTNTQAENAGKDTNDKSK